MTTDEVKNILKRHHDKISIYIALSCVNLTDNELKTIIYRYMRGMTQERTAEKLGESTSVNTVFSFQQSAVNKIAKMWSDLPLAKILLKTLD